MLCASFSSKDFVIKMKEIGEVQNEAVHGTGEHYRSTGDCFELLVYEDDDEHFDEIVQSLLNISSSERIFRVLRLSDPFKISSPFDKLEYEEWKKLFSLGKYQPPKKYLILKNDIELIDQEHGEWWPNDFDAAILDIYHFDKGPIGDDIASWLQNANFIGPVLLTSKRAIPTDLSLSPVDQFVKDDSVNWSNNIARVVDNRIDIVKKITPKVSVNGRDPASIVTQMYDNPKYNNPLPWSAIWVDNNDMNSQNFKADTLQYFNINEVQYDASMTNLRFVSRESSPEIIFMDSGQMFKEGTAQEILSLLDYLGSYNIRPIVVVLASDISFQLSSSTHAALFSKLTTYADRETFADSPTFWIHEATKKLIHYLKLYTEDGTYAEPFFRSMLPLYIAARAKQRIIGSKNHPVAYARYVSSLSDAHVLNTSLTKKWNAAMEQLLTKESLDKSVLRKHELLPDSLK